MDTEINEEPEWGWWNGIQGVCAAEFDYKKGSIVSVQYPEKVTRDEGVLADLMIPDQSHKRESDWTVGFIDVDSDKGRTYALLSHVGTRLSKSVKRGGIIKAIGICTSDKYLECYKPFLVLALEELFLLNNISSTKKVVEKLYDCLRKVKIRIVTLSLLEKRIVLFSDSRDILRRKLLKAQCGNGGDTSDSRISNGHAVYTLTTSGKAINVPLKIPYVMPSSLVLDISLAPIIQRLLNVKININGCSALGLVLRAVLQNFRVIIFSSNDSSARFVVENVLGIIWLASARGTLYNPNMKIYPYMSLSLCEKLFEKSTSARLPKTGFIAGVTNSAVLSFCRYDLLVNLSENNCILHELFKTNNSEIFENQMEILANNGASDFMLSSRVADWIINDSYNYSLIKNNINYKDSQNSFLNKDVQDIQYYMYKLIINNQNKYKDLNIIGDLYIKLHSLVVVKNDNDAILALIASLGKGLNGTYHLCAGLFHPNKHVQLCVAQIISTISENDYGVCLFEELNSFYKTTYKCILDGK